jgi:hypothetical protein
MAGQYCDGFDENGKWTLESAYEAIERQGVVVDLGQITPAVKRRLDALVRNGTLIKYRGYWDTLLTLIGMGPLKTIWAVPEIATAAGVAK